MRLALDQCGLFFDMEIIMRFKSFIALSFVFFFQMAGAALPTFVMCDACTDVQMTRKAEMTASGRNAVIVIDRSGFRYFKYVVTREVEPDQIFTTLQRTDLSTEEEDAVLKGLEIYRKLGNMQKVDVGVLPMSSLGRDQMGSAINFVANPMAMRSLNNAINDYVTQSVMVGAMTSLTTVTINTIIKNTGQSITVQFPDGSSWTFDLARIAVDAERGGLRMEYTLNERSGIDSKGNPIPFSANDLLYFSVSGNGPFLQRYVDMVNRLGLPVLGGSQPAECVVIGMRCDKDGCIFIYDCP